LRTKNQIVFPSVNACAKYFKCSITPVRNKLHGKSVKNKQLKGVTLKYLSEKEQTNDKTTI